MAERSGLDTRIDVPPSLIELVLPRIRSAILTRQMVPGQPLVEAEIARNFGVSKTPVREALKILSSSGLVTFVPYKGASVRVVDEEFVRETYDVRLLLEPEAVRRSVSVGTTSHLDEAEEALAEARVTDDRAQLSLLNRRFHAALYADCNNDLMSEILENLRDRAALVSVAGWEAAPTFEVEWTEHRAILDAAQRGDAAAAAHLLHDHISGFFSRTLTKLTGSDG
jgi:DNA-binding GntR family transcriptional regulator